MNETIHIYHTNDLHSHFEHWPRIHAFLQERKRWHEKEGEVCLLLDIGDHIDRSHPYTEATAGLGNVEMLNDSHYDAVTIGNNEGITLSKKELNLLYTQADFDVIVGNLFHPDGERPNWAKQHHILTTAGGTRIGLIGATAEFTPFYERLGWKVTPGREALIEAAAAIRAEADIIICLSHLGIREDEILAAESNDIDIILGAHTHHVFHEGKQIDAVLLGAAGKFGAYIGHVTIEGEHSSRARLVETASLPEAEPEFNHRLLSYGKDMLSDPVFSNRRLLKAEWFKDSEMADEFAEALLLFSGADCAMFNAGIFMKDLKEGIVTRFDFHQLLPHPINPCLIELSGAELREIYLESLNSEWPEIQLKGLGFRGTVMGKMIHRELQMNGHTLEVQGNAVQPDHTYRLITLDMFTFGHFFPSLKRAQKTYFMPEFLRDVFALYFQKRF
ncbi:bifunctional metallophosphatase/5'-nucleotidase [Planococcus lenghuensis]|uniref:Bifunctional metallophosphatase/5'-nucleotidase n=1 Tax=Planococcus lenghuensis TaxID=2213202 RepID=A0A1Q2L3H3_9BACL|nr:bifunctional metallophosphatase/5'-nucleotidase [Planococcus lenghuensis]AQQ55018.1 bifunctional metallophosphatase/5'-nucleotidase [Planococcus lenghuensis]